MIPTVVANATRKQTGSTLAQDQTWWVVWNSFFQILGIIIPTDFHIFQRGTVGQPPTRNCGSCWDGNVIDRNDRELATTICQGDLLRFLRPQKDLNVLPATQLAVLPRDGDHGWLKDLGTIGLPKINIGTRWRHVTSTFLSGLLGFDSICSFNMGA